MMEVDACEINRMAALRRYDILDTPPDGAFDGITSLAAKLLRVPIALTSLVDTDRIWFKSRHGLDVEQIPRDPGLCASAILNSEPYVVEDARLDPRTLGNPLVAGEFGLQFYAAVPLTTSDSFNLGTLCVIDREPRTLLPDEMEILQTLASLVIDQMELRIASRQIAQRNDELRAINEERQAFLAIASHDLRHPLTGIMMLGNLLAEQQVGPLNTDQRDMIARICESSDLMSELIDKYMEHSAVQSSHLKLHLETANVGEIIRNSLQAYESEAAAKSIRLAMEPEDEIVEANLDIARLQQVISNLISNAIKFSPPGTEVRVGCRIEGEKAVITVRDEGQGIPECDRSQLFKPFSQLSPRATAGEKGTGLGLSIAKRLIDAHGGEIILGTEQTGATFVITIPR